MQRKPKTFPFCQILEFVWSYIPQSDVLVDTHNWSVHQVRDLGYNIRKHLKMALYSQVSPISHLNTTTRSITLS